MKVGFFGGIILLALTILFSAIALQNNKIAREVAIKSFNLKRVKIKDKNLTAKDGNRTKTVIVIHKEDSFEKEFKNFDKQFDNF